MTLLQEFLNSLKGKKIHIVGITGAEGSSILNLLAGSNLKGIVAHDFIEKGEIEKNFKLWHKGLTVEKRNEQFLKFRKTLNYVEFHDSASYLYGIESADIIFLPQSWRLYKQNKKLIEAKLRGTLFYSLMRLYLDFAPCINIGVTGTVGKGSVANLIYQILILSGRTAYFTGNETWRLQLASQLNSMNVNDYLVLEISHRQLMDGFNRSPEIVVFTNLYPNHLDELSYQKYCDVKLSLLKKQSSNQKSVINYDNNILRKASYDLKSQITYYSDKNPNMNKIDIQRIYSELMKIKSAHYSENILAASTAATIIGVPAVNLPAIIKKIPSLQARFQSLGKINGVEVIDDIKSTTPWATLAAISKLSGSVILLVGGDTKGISYEEFYKSVIAHNIKLIVLESALSRCLEKNFADMNFIAKKDLESAISYALSIAEKNSKLLISPAAANFYSHFIKGKKSIKKILKDI